MTTPNTTVNNPDNRINNTPAGDGAVNGSTTNTQPTGLGCSDGVSTGGRENDPQSVHFNNPQGDGSARQRQCQEQNQKLHNSNTTTSQGGSAKVGNTTSTSEVTGSGNSRSSNHNSAEGGTGVGVGKGGNSDATSISGSKSSSGGNTQGVESSTGNNAAATGGAKIEGVGNDSSVTKIDARTEDTIKLVSPGSGSVVAGCKTKLSLNGIGEIEHGSQTGAIQTGFSVAARFGENQAGIGVFRAKVIQAPEGSSCISGEKAESYFDSLFARPAAAPVRFQSESAAGQGQAVIINMPAQPAQPPRVERRRASAESSNYVAMVQVDTHVAPSPQFGLVEALFALLG